MIKKLTGAIVIIIFIGILTSILLEQNRFSKDLFSSSINSKILKVEYEGRGGYKYFYKDGVFFTGDYFSMFKQTQFLVVGDSISKAPNCWTFKAYRKNKSGNYVFWREFRRNEQDR
jgi:hypothetical protein